MVRLAFLALVLGALGVVGVVSGVGASAASASGDPLTLITEPDAGMAPIYAFLASARHTVDLVMYEFEDVEAERILAADAARGVRVRVILDQADVGAVNRPARSYLLAHGVAVRWASSRYELTHEKSAVVDGRAALVTTMNLGPARYESTDRDFAVLDSDPKDVAAIDSTFDADWRATATVPSPGSDLLWSPGAEDEMVALVESARSAVLVENEEMGDSRVTHALERAAAHSVDVVVVMTRSSEWSAALDALAAAGVEVRTYPEDSTSLYIHAKVIAVDPGHADSRVFVGSQNFSSASLDRNRELGIVTADPSLVRAIAYTVDRDARAGTPDS